MGHKRFPSGYKSRRKKGVPNRKQKSCQRTRKELPNRRQSPTSGPQGSGLASEETRCRGGRPRRGWSRAGSGSGRRPYLVHGGLGQVQADRAAQNRVEPLLQLPVSSPSALAGCLSTALCRLLLPRVWGIPMLPNPMVTSLLFSHLTSWQHLLQWMKFLEKLSLVTFLLYHILFAFLLFCGHS